VAVLRPSTELSHGELAELFTAAYEGYFVPFRVDEATLGFMVDVFDLDLELSLVAVEDGTPVRSRQPGPARRVHLARWRRRRPEPSRRGNRRAAHA
jgi:hypothetical protein